jgi:2'-5' RNA ligase
MRSFIAVDIKNSALVGILDELAQLKAGLKLVEPQNLHLTLKFLGEVGEDMVGDIYDAMIKAFSPFSPFEVSLRGVGVFPSLRYIRVIWVGIEENKEKLIEMQSRLEENLSSLGIGKERKKFDPHLTLARVRSPRGREDVKDFVVENATRSFGKALVDKVELKRSTLTPKGPIYSTIKSVAL